MNRSLPLVLLLLLGAPGLTIAQAPKHPIPWKRLDQMTANQGSVAYYFRNANSVLCKEVEEDVWRDLQVAEAAKPFTCVVVNLDSGQNISLAQQYNVVWVPAVVLVDQGKELRRLERSVVREEYIRFFKNESSPTPIPTVAAAAPAADPSLTTVPDGKGEAADTALDFVSIGGALNADGLTVVLGLAGPPSANLALYNVFVDVDANPATGFSNGEFRGAELMIQQGTLHRFTGSTPTEWSWQPGQAVTAQPTGNQISYQIPATALSGAATVSIFANSQGADWTIADWAPDSGPLRIGSGASAPSAQPATAAPTSSGVVRYTDPAGDAQGEGDILGATAEVIGSDMRFTVELATVPAPNSVHVMLDADGRPATGFGDANRSGADFMIEGTLLHRHDEAAGNGWGWKPMGEVQLTIEGTRATITVPRSRVGISEGQPINLWFYTTDSNWNDVDFLPDNGTERFPK